MKKKKAVVGPVVVVVLGAVLILVMIPRAARAERCNDEAKRERREQRAREQRERQQQEQQQPVSDNADSPEDDDCVERNIYWMPGAFGAFFQPTAGLGAFYGAGVQFAPFQWSHNNDRFGPSHGGMLLQAGLLKSPRSDSTLALFEIGGTASFERNASRKWLIPYFGATFGGLTHSELGTSAYAYPLGGLHIFWHQNFMLDGEGGYHLPFSDIDRAKGPRAQLSARFSLW